jgi:hypothetical protein
MTDRELLRVLTRRVADEGRLVEVGWLAARRHIAPPGAGAAELDTMRTAFMAGAQHLFSSIRTVLDPGARPTAADLRRLGLLHAELEAFRSELELRLARARGHA